MITGGCLCGGVQYEVDELGEVGHCHCTMCQKAHGAAFATYALVARDQFRFTAGSDLVHEFESSGGTFRSFCGRCGSNLQFRRTERPSFGIALGTVDGDPGVRPSYQIWMSSRAPWYDSATDLRSHDAQP